MPVNEPLIRALRLDAPARIAEVACGAGGTAIQVFRSAPEGSVVHGFDISPALIDLARKQLGPEERNIAFEVADIAKAVPDKPYERLFSRFGVMFFDDPPAAFANLARWLERGGRFAFAVWGPPEQNPWMTTVQDVMGRVVEVPRVDPEGPGMFRYSAPDKLRTLLERAGFNELEMHDFQGQIPLGGGLAAAEAASFALTTFSSFADLLAKAGDNARSEAHQLLTDAFSKHQQNGIVQMDACVHIFTGTRA